MAAEFAVLSDPTHSLPWPGDPSRLFNPAGELIDTDDPFWIGVLADGTEVALEHGSKTLMASRIVDAIAAFLRGSQD